MKREGKLSGNQYSTIHEVGHVVRLLHLGESAYNEKSRIIGYDLEGYYMVARSDGRVLLGISDRNLEKYKNSESHLDLADFNPRNYINYDVLNLPGGPRGVLPRIVSRDSYDIIVSGDPSHRGKVRVSLVHHESGDEYWIQVTNSATARSVVSTLLEGLDKEWSVHFILSQGLVNARDSVIRSGTPKSKVERPSLLREVSKLSPSQVDPATYSNGIITLISNCQSPSEILVTMYSSQGKWSRVLSNFDEAKSLLLKLAKYIDQRSPAWSEHPFKVDRDCEEIALLHEMTNEVTEDQEIKCEDTVEFRDLTDDELFSYEALKLPGGRSPMIAKGDNFNIIICRSNSVTNKMSKILTVLETESEEWWKSHDSLDEAREFAEELYRCSSTNDKENLEDLAVIFEMI